MGCSRLVAEILDASSTKMIRGIVMPSEALHFSVPGRFDHRPFSVRFSRVHEDSD